MSDTLPAGEVPRVAVPRIIAIANQKGGVCC